MLQLTSLQLVYKITNPITNNKFFTVQFTFTDRWQILEGSIRGLTGDLPYSFYNQLQKSNAMVFRGNTQMLLIFLFFFFTAMHISFLFKRIFLIFVNVKKTYFMHFTGTILKRAILSSSLPQPSFSS